MPKNFEKDGTGDGSEVTVFGDGLGGVRILCEKTGHREVIQYMVQWRVVRLRDCFQTRLGLGGLASAIPHRYMTVWGLFSGSREMDSTCP